MLAFFRTVLFVWTGGRHGAMMDFEREYREFDS